MRRPIVLVSITLLIASFSGCLGTVPLAPGADKVTVTRLQSNVASCLALGNIDGQIRGSSPDQFDAQMRNQAVGLGGNTVFDTSVAGTGISGVIYRCK